MNDDLINWFLKVGGAYWVATKVASQTLTLRKQLKELEEESKAKKPEGKDSSISKDKDEEIA